jgi:threonine-phosphate decarboxylase
VHGDGIRYYYEERFGIPASRVAPGNGSTELIYLLPRALDLNTSLIITPSYDDYQRACAISGTRIKRYTISLGNDLHYEIDSLKEHMEGVDSVWMGRPNNPTGTLFPKELVVELVSKYPDKWVIIDEAFIQFVDKWEKESFLMHHVYPNLIVLHSLTKFYSLAGLRLGAVIAHEHVINRIMSLKEPWSVNGVSERVAMLLVGCREYEAESSRFLNHERERFFEELQAVASVEVFPTRSNFFLCRLNMDLSLDEFIRSLLEHGIYVRDCRNFHGLNGNYFRIGIRLKEQNHLLINIIRGMC